MHLLHPTALLGHFLQLSAEIIASDPVVPDADSL
jgi:hypothetical protein